MDNDEPIRGELSALRARVAATLDARAPTRSRSAARPASAPRARTSRISSTTSFIEYGGLALAAQRLRLPIDELIETSPADGLVSGVGTVAGARTLVLAYDYTVFAGTQGGMSHKKLDRMLALARAVAACRSCCSPRAAAGGRTTPTCRCVAGLDTPSFLAFAALCGLAPRVGIVVGAVLRRQRRAARLLRRHHRDRGQHRSAWAARR